MSKVRCKYCKTYIDKEGAVSAGISSFCSEEHYQNHVNKVYEPKVRPTTKAPARKKQRLPGVPPQVEQHVLEGDGHRCRMCGNSNYYDLALHHICYRSEVDNRPWMNQPWNLITLCNYTCHLKTVHGDKRTYKPLLLGLTWLREVHGDASMNVKRFKEELLKETDEVSSRYGN